MRMENRNKDASSIRAGKGRAVLFGFGLDDAAGHIRYTKAEDVELLGGSEETHQAMQSKALRIKMELQRLGYCLDNIRRDQLDEVRRIVERVSSE